MTAPAATQRACQTCGSPVMMNDGYCWNCSPNISEQERAAARQRGGLTVTKGRRPLRVLDEAELGELASPADAQRWARVIALGAATGRLSASQASAAMRAVAEFIKARDLEAREGRLARLEQEVEQLRGRTSR